MKENLENPNAQSRGFTSRVVEGSQCLKNAICWTQSLAKMPIRSYLISTKGGSKEKDGVTNPRAKTNNR